MARKDEIFKSFLEHDLLTEKYQLKKEQIPDKINAGLRSDIPIIKAIALIIEKNEVSDSALRNLLTQYLSEAV